MEEVLLHQSEIVKYLTYIALAVVGCIVFEIFLRITGLVVYRYFTAVMYTFYLIVLPLAIVFLFQSPNILLLTEKVPPELLSVAAFTVGFYFYSIFRLIRFPNKKRNVPEIYHHVVFMIFGLVIILFPDVSLLLFAWFYLQQLSILSYYIGYIIPIRNENARKRVFLIHFYMFFVFKVLLVFVLLAYTLVFHAEITSLAVFTFLVILLTVSTGFNMFWFIRMIPLVKQYGRELKQQT